MNLESDILARFKYGMGDLTTMGVPSTGVSFLTNEQLARIHPERFNFYVQLTMALMSGNPDVVYRVLGIEGASRNQRERVKELLNDIGNELGQMTSQKQIGEIAEAVKKESQVPAIRDVGANAKLQTSDVGTVAKPTNTDASSSTEVENGGQSSKKRRLEGGGYWRTMKDYLEPRKDNVVMMMKAAESNAQSPTFSMETMNSTTTDRIIFIAVTFALRSFALTFLEWALTNRMVNTSAMAIVYYVGMYLLLFTLWVLIVNVGRQEVFFKVAFFFVNTQGGRGMVNIILHVFMQLLLLPVPFILQTINPAQSNSSDFMSYEDQRRTLRLVGNLSFLMWMVSSVVALRA